VISYALVHWMVKVTVNFPCNSDMWRLQRFVKRSVLPYKTSVATFRERSNEKSVLIARCTKRAVRNICPYNWNSGKKLARQAILRAAEMRPLPLRVDSTNASICRAASPVARPITPSELRQHLHKVWRAVRIFRPLNRRV